MNDVLPQALILLVVAFLSTVVILRRRQSNEQAMRAYEDRLANLTARFGADAAVKILAQTVWQGETAEMLVESMGYPVAIDEDVSPKRVRRTFKYGQLAAREFALRVTLEDDVVTGWKTRD